MSPTTVIRLADDSNVSMLENDRFDEYHSGICIDCGIWDMNNVGQEPNPLHFPGKDGKKMCERLGFTYAEFGRFTSFPDIYTGFAITADDGLYGPIENITVDGIFAENCHSAVRLLSHGLPIKNVHIRKA